MSNYTRLHLRAVLDVRIMSEVDTAVLGYLSLLRDEPSLLPEHQFFKTKNWRHIISKPEILFESASRLSFDLEDETVYLAVDSELVSYEQEVELFLNYITPFFSEDYKDEFIGYIISPNDIVSLLFIKKEVIVVKEIDLFSLDKI